MIRNHQKDEYLHVYKYLLHIMNYEITYVHNQLNL